MGRGVNLGAVVPGKETGVSTWTQDEDWRFQECIRQATREATTAQTAVGGHVSGAHASDPGGDRWVDTPGGQAKVKQVVVWMPDANLEVTLPVDLVRALKPVTRPTTS
jgi:hypothetical protein